MALDPNIIMQGRPVQIENPLTQLAQIAKLQGAQSQNKLAELSLGEKQRGFEEDNAVRQVYANGTDGKSRLEALAKVSPKGYQAEAKFQTEQQKSQRDAEKSQIEMHLKKFEAAGQIMAPVKDQATWAIAKQETARAFGPEAAAQMPDMYDPALVDQKRAQAMTVKDQLEQTWKQKGYDLDVEKFGETKTHNRNTEKNAAGQLAVSQGNLAVSRTREAREAAAPKGQYDPDRGLLVDPRTGVAKPVIGPDGVPLGGKDKMTEDQGKATGWLVQAQNAFNNMNDAVKSKPSASKPGFPDVVAGIPSMGIGGAVGNMMRGTDRQKFLQGSSSLSESLLRAATGAGVNKDEAAQKVRELTPVFGDSDENISQKMAAIPLYIESLKVRAGPGAKKATAIVSAAKPPNIDDLLKKYGD